MTVKDVLAVYAGSFDPPTLGHKDIIHRATKLFGRVVVAVGVNPKKTSLFPTDVRVAMLEEMTAEMRDVTVDSFQGLLIDYCAARGARAVIRGLRAVSDFEQELTLAHANGDLSPGIETVWLPTKPVHSFVSSSMVKEIASHGGNVSHYVDTHVERALKEKYTSGR